MNVVAVALLAALALNPDVSQENTHETICRRGWTRTVRPPLAYTSAVKRRMAAAQGVDPRDYILDHVVPLELGGSPTAPGNLQLQAPAEAHAKDVIEDRLRRAVCRGEMTLRDAQEQVAR